MSFVRTLVRDLVEKRLWPVALLMIVALVAIPVIGGGGDAGAGEEAVPVAAVDAPSQATPVELRGPPSARTRAGRVVDPFRRPSRPDEQTGPAGDSGGSGGTTGSTGTSGSGDATGSGGTTGSGDATETGDASTPGDPAPKPPPPVYRTTVRWSSGDAAKAGRISRLTPLGGPMGPALLYLGVAEESRHALFLLVPAATSTGEAGCTDANCRVIAIASGESQIVDLQPAGAALSQFELEVVSVKRDATASAASAARARAREHPAGRDLLRSLIRDPLTAKVMGAFAYDRRNGVMVAAPTASGPAAP